MKLPDKQGRSPLYPLARLAGISYDNWDKTYSNVLERRVLSGTPALKGGACERASAT